MKKRIRIMSFILFVSVLMTLFSVPQSGIAEAVSFETEYLFLQSLGVLKDEIQLTEDVSRGAFSAVVARILYPDAALSQAGTQAQEKPFEDVEPSHPYYKEIRMMKELGILSGDSRTKFMPDHEISYTEALAVLIKSLGYGIYAEAEGGYPTGYLVVANSSGISKGVTKNTESISGSVAVKLIYNALFADIVSIASIQNGQATSEIVAGKNILSERLGIREYDALVIDDGFQTLNGESPLGNGKVVIREIKTDTRIIVDDNEKKLNDFIGQRVKIFIRDNKELDKMEIVFCKPYSNAKIVTLDSDLIISSKDDFIEYETEKDSGKYQKIKFGSSRPYVLFNGVARNQYEMTELIPANGFVTAIDNNNDGIFDVLRVTELNYNVIVDKVDNQQKIIFCRQNPQHNLDFSDENAVNYRILKDGTVADMEDLTALDVVSVAVSPLSVDGKILYTLYVSSISKTAAVSSVISDSSRLELQDGTQLKISSDLLQLRPKLLEQIAFGKEMTFRLDIKGNVAYIDKLASSSKNFTYLINIMQESGIDDTILVKLFSSELGMQILPLSSKVIIDGKKPDSASFFESVQNLLCTRPDGSVTVPTNSVTQRQNKSFTSIVPRPAIIKVNANKEIISIETDAKTHSNSAEEEEDNNVLKAQTRIAKSSAYLPNARTFDGRFFLTEDTIILKVPDVDRYGLEECVPNIGATTWKYSEIQTNKFEQDLNNDSYYKLMSAGEVNENMNYDIQAYNVDPKTGIAEFAVIRGWYEYYYHKNNYQAPFGVYEKMTDYVDINTGNIYKKIYYYLGGEEKSAVVDRDTLHPYYENIIFGGKVAKNITYTGKADYPETTTYLEVEPLKKGDIIYVESSGGKLSHIQREINISRINEKATSSMRPAAARYPYSNGAYSATSVGIPFDQRPHSTAVYTDTYLLGLGVAMDMSGSTVMLRMPEKGSFGADYIGKEDSCRLLDKYIDLSSVKITVVEEEKCDAAHDNCDFKIRGGTLSDVITASSYTGNPATDGFYKASRIYSYSRYGLYSEIVIFNLKEEHNRYIPQ